MKLYRLFFLLYLLCMAAFASGQTATISGRVENEDGKPMAGVSVTILGKQSGTATTDSGKFSIQVRAGKAIALVFTSTGYNQKQRNFYLSAGELETITIA